MFLNERGVATSTYSIVAPIVGPIARMKLSIDSKAWQRQVSIQFNELCNILSYALLQFYHPFPSLFLILGSPGFSHNLFYFLVIFCYFILFQPLEGQIIDPSIDVQYLMDDVLRLDDSAISCNCYLFQSQVRVFTPQSINRSIVQ